MILQVKSKSAKRSLLLKGGTAGTQYPMGGGWPNPSEKYARQIGSFPQVGIKIFKEIETAT